MSKKAKSSSALAAKQPTLTAKQRAVAKQLALVATRAAQSPHSLPCAMQVVALYGDGNFFEGFEDGEGTVLAHFQTLSDEEGLRATDRLALFNLLLRIVWAENDRRNAGESLTDKDADADGAEAEEARAAASAARLAGFDGRPARRPREGLAPWDDGLRRFMERGRKPVQPGCAVADAVIWAMRTVCAGTPLYPGEFDAQVHGLLGRDLPSAARFAAAWAPLDADAVEPVLRLWAAKVTWPSLEKGFIECYGRHPAARHARRRRSRRRRTTCRRSTRPCPAPSEAAPPGAVQSRVRRDRRAHAHASRCWNIGERRPAGPWGALAGARPRRGARRPAARAECGRVW